MTGRAKVAAALTAGVGLTLGASTVAGKAPWQTDPYCRDVAGVSSVQVVNVATKTKDGKALVLPQPADTEVTCK